MPDRVCVYTYGSVPITNADDGPYKRVGAENDGGGGSRVATREGWQGGGMRGPEARGLWQSTQGLEAKRLIPQEALHPVLIRREFYERFERYPLCELGSRREYAWRDAALRPPAVPPRFAWKYWSSAKGTQDDFAAHRAGSYDYRNARCFCGFCLLACSKSDSGF